LSSAKSVRSRVLYYRSFFLVFRLLSSSEMSAVYSGWPQLMTEVSRRSDRGRADGATIRQPARCVYTSENCDRRIWVEMRQCCLDGRVAKDGVDGMRSRVVWSGVKLTRSALEAKLGKSWRLCWHGRRRVQTKGQDGLRGCRRTTREEQVRREHSAACSTVVPSHSNKSLESLLAIVRSLSALDHVLTSSTRIQYERQLENPSIPSMYRVLLPRDCVCRTDTRNDMKNRAQLCRIDCQAVVSRDWWPCDTPFGRP